MVKEYLCCAVELGGILPMEIMEKEHFDCAAELEDLLRRQSVRTAEIPVSPLLAFGSWGCEESPELPISVPRHSSSLSQIEVVQHQVHVFGNRERGRAEVS